MVGVPGRSKGCHTCRRRKIKCTLEKPFCSQCTRTNRPCEGYVKAHIFVTTIVEPKAKPALTEKWRPDAYRVPPSEPTEEDVIFTNLGLAFTMRLENMQNNILKQQLLGCWIGRSPSARSRHHWLTTIPTMAVPTRALETAAFALCTARLGRVGGLAEDKALIVQSLKLYGLGLRALAKALEDPKLRYRDETMGACILLAAYEAYECPNGNRAGYLSHNRGCEKLMKARGPEAHRTGLGHSLFQAYRTISGMEATGRKKSFLGEPVWQEVPFEEIPRSHYDSLVDLCLTAPNLMDQAEEIFRGESAIEMLERALDLTDAIWVLERELRDIYVDLEMTVEGPLFWPMPMAEWAKDPGYTSLSETILSEPPLQFADLRSGRTLILYWAMLVCIWDGLNDIHKLVSNLAFPVAGEREDLALRAANLPPLNHRATGFAGMGRNVLRAVDFCMQDDIQISLLMGPLHMVLTVIIQYPQYSREVLCAQKALERLAERGVGMVKCLPMWKPIGGEEQSRSQILATLDMVPLEVESSPTPSVRLLTATA